MLYTVLPLSITVIVGLFTTLVYQQYRRVRKRDVSRLRVQKHTDSPKVGFSLDPLDHSLYWYPIAFSHEVTIGSKQPFACSLLNEPLCLYRIKTGDVVCVLDMCPHRSAPLSLGQITKDGNLECIYHGWQYGANGQCVYIPSVSKASKAASLICARALPVHEQYGFIWVWPGKRDLASSDLIPHSLFADVQRADGSFLLSPEYSCYLDIPYDLMFDNLLDMAHIDFTHDGTIGKRSQASCIRSERISPAIYSSTNTESVSFKVTRHEQPLPLSSIESSVFNFIPPCFVRINHRVRNSEKLFIQIFVILPSAEKKMRLLLQFYRNFARYKWIEYIPGYDYLADRMNKKVVDQDVLLLNGIHRNIEDMGASVLGTTVSADQPIKAFRQFQAKSLAKFRGIYVERKAWLNRKKNLDTEKSDQEFGLLDIEDIGST